PASARATTDAGCWSTWARWCEPCHRFHAAAARGELTGRLGTGRLIEPDLDWARSRRPTPLRAGYQSSLIPLFALPGPDGHASGRQIEGSIKGEGAVGAINPRLLALLGWGPCGRRRRACLPRPGDG